MLEAGLGREEGRIDVLVSNAGIQIIKPGIDLPFADCDSKIPGCSSIRSEVICDQLVGDKAIFLQQLAHQFERRPLVPPGVASEI